MLAPTHHDRTLSPRVAALLTTWWGWSRLMMAIWNMLLDNQHGHIHTYVPALMYTSTL